MGDGFIFKRDYLKLCPYYQDNLEKGLVEKTRSLFAIVFFFLCLMAPGCAGLRLFPYHK